MMPKFVGTPKKSAGRGTLYEKSRKAVMARESECWICAGRCPDFSWPPGQMPFDSTIVDKTLKWPDPGSPSSDHIIPISMLAADDPRLWRVDAMHLSHLRCNSARGAGKRITTIETLTSRNWLA